MPISVVTGGAGFIGGHLVAQLLERGDRVRVLDPALGAKPGRNWGPDIELICGSVCDPGRVRQALKGADRLFHLAALAQLWIPCKRDYLAVNAEGTRIALDMAARFNLDRVVHCSTETVLVGTRSQPGVMVDETASVQPDEALGPYSRSKLLAEAVALKAGQGGHPVVIANPTMPLGPGDPALTPPMRMVKMFLTRPPPFFLNGFLNIVDVRDAASGLILAAERGIPGRRYILGGETLTTRQFLDVLEDVSGRPMPKRSLPGTAALAVGALSEWISDHVTHKPPIAPLEGVRLALKQGPVRTDSARRELKFSSRPLRETVADTLEWFANSECSRQ